MIILKDFVHIKKSRNKKAYLQIIYWEISIKQIGKLT